MLNLTIGEKIVLAERDLQCDKKHYDFCMKVHNGKIKLERHFAHLLIPVAFDDYSFDEDEEYYFEQEQEIRTISKEEWIAERKEKIRQRAIDNYNSTIEKYSNVNLKELKRQIDEAELIIKRAKSKHFFSYFIANSLSSRMYSPSFHFKMMGVSLVEGMGAGLNGEKLKHLSWLDQISLEM